MIKFLDRLERSKTFWTLLLFGIAFFFLRLPSLIEPYWYGDEGIYQIIGIALGEGKLLYTDIWDNKPPLLYLVYALFAGDQFAVRLASLIAGLGAMITFFFLSQSIFKKRFISIITTALFVILFGTPYLEGNIANAENFILFPILLAAFLIYQTKKREVSHFSSSLFLAGFLIGIGFLFKIVALFDLLTFLLFLFIIQDEGKIKSVIQSSLSLVSGFIIPIILSLFWFAFQGNLSDFIRSAFINNVGYVEYHNTLIIPQGFLILKIVILLFMLSLLLYKRKQLSKPTAFVLLWTTFSIFNAFFSQRPYTHYLLITLPSLCLFVGLILAQQKRTMKIFLSVSFLAIITILFFAFELSTRYSVISYYENTLLFVTGQRDLSSYQSFFDPETPRDYQLVSFIKQHTDEKDQIFLWGNSPQIYALTQKLPPGKYTVAYHVAEFEDGLSDTKNALNKSKPMYIITLDEVQIIPVPLQGYHMKYSIPGAIIYERTY